MANYLQIESDKWTKVDGEKAEILHPTELQNELVKINSRLNDIPPSPTDEELLAWAKLNYPGMDYSKEKESLVSRKSQIEVDLSNMGF